MAEIKISISYVFAVIRSVWSIFPTIINYISRPKAKIEIKNHIIVIKNEQGIESHISYPCILISSPKDIKIDVRSIKLNNEQYTCMLSGDPNFLNQKEGSKNPVTITNNRIMPYVSKNWLQLQQQSCLFEIKGLGQEAFPLFIKKDRAHFLFKHKKHPKVFFAKRKLVISMCIDGKMYDYALPLMEVCKLVINHLAFKVE